MYRCVQLSAIQTSSIDTRHKTPKSVLGISYNTCYFPLFALSSQTNEQTHINPKVLYITHFHEFAHQMLTGRIQREKELRMILCMRYGTFPTHVNLIRCFNNSKKSINWRNVALQEVNNCRWFSCLITQRLLRELPPISVTKLWGSMFTRFLIKEVKKKTSIDWWLDKALWGSGSL